MTLPTQSGSEKEPRASDLIKTTHEVLLLSVCWFLLDPLGMLGRAWGRDGSPVRRDRPLVVQEAFSCAQYLLLTISSSKLILRGHDHCRELESGETHRRNSLLSLV